MPAFKDITVVAIHGNSGIHTMLPALERTASALPGCNKLLITNEYIQTDIPQALIHQTQSYETYSHFVVYCLHNYIQTDYALIVQDDGWVLNADNWRNEWFNYDYVGGLTHAALDGKDLYWQYSWVNNPNARSLKVVQNGGFSLRSKFLLEAPSKYGITMVPQQMAELNNEDIQLCCIMRESLEGIGVQFAPWEEAMLFSVEHLSPDIHKDLDLNKLFGHHSRFRRLTGYKDVSLHYTEEQIKQIPWEDRVLDLFKHYGYNLCQAKQIQLQQLRRL